MKSIKILFIAFSMVCASAQANESIKQYLIPEGYKVLNYLTPYIEWCNSEVNVKTKKCKAMATQASEKAQRHGHKVADDYFLSKEYIQAFVQTQVKAKAEMKKGETLRARLLFKKEFNKKAHSKLLEFKGKG